MIDFRTSRFALSSTAITFLVIASGIGLLSNAIWGWGPVLFHSTAFSFWQELFVRSLPSFWYGAIIVLLSFRQKGLAYFLSGAACLGPLASIPYFLFVAVLSSGSMGRSFWVIRGVILTSVIFLPGVIAGVLHRGLIAQRMALAIIGGLCGYVALGMEVSGLSHAYIPLEPWQQSNPNGPPDPRKVEQFMFHVTACNYEYRSKHSDIGYARDLRDLGYGGLQCLTPEENEHHFGYEIRYAVEKSKSNPVVHFEVTAAPAKNRPIMMMDESGILFDNATTDGDTLERWLVSSTFFSQSGLDEIEKLRRCVALQYKGTGKWPTQVYDLEKPAVWCNLSRDLRIVNATTLATYAYTMEMETTKPNISPEFIFKPRSYGSSGIRSYLLTTDGIVHVTPEDRIANSADPPACELSRGGCTAPKLLSGAY